MITLLSVSTANSDQNLVELLKDYGFNVTNSQRSIAVILPECPMSPGDLLRANNKPWAYFDTIVKLRRHYMNVYRCYASTLGNFSEDTKQVATAVNLLNALTYHMSHKIVTLLANPSKKGAANALTPELMQYVSVLSHSPDPADTCLKITRMCNETFEVRFIICVAALVNNHLDVYAKFNTVT